MKRVLLTIHKEYRYQDNEIIGKTQDKVFVSNSQISATHLVIIVLHKNKTILTTAKGNTNAYMHSYTRSVLYYLKLYFLTQWKTCICFTELSNKMIKKKNQKIKKNRASKITTL